MSEIEFSVALVRRSKRCHRALGSLLTLLQRTGPGRKADLRRMRRHVMLGA